MLSCNDSWHKHFWHNWSSNGSSSSHLTQHLFLHYLGKTEQTKYALTWEQQTSTNWRLDRIKIWPRQSELMKYMVYLLTIVLPGIKHVTDDTFVFQQDSAPAHRLAKRSNCWSAKPPSDFISPDLWPPTALTSIWSITSSGGSCNSRSIRRRSRMWMNSGSNRLKSGLVWSRTLLTPLSMHGETICVLVFVQRADISNIYCRQLNNWTIG